jgi:transposase
MKAYPQDLRERILQTVDEGKTQAETASLFKVSEASVKRYVRQRREKGHVQPKPIPGRPPTKRVPLEAELQPQLESQPDATLHEHCQKWEAASGVKVSISTWADRTNEVCSAAPESSISNESLRTATKSHCWSRHWRR